MQKKHPTYSDDLHWLFRVCESEMGIKSNFNALMLACKVGTQRTIIEDDEIVSLPMVEAFNEDTLIDAIDTYRALSRMQATRKNRSVMRAYCSLGKQHKIVLEAAYADRQYPPEVRDFFGPELAGVLHLTETAQKIRKFSMGWVASAIIRKDPIISKLRAEADGLLRAATGAYGRRQRELREQQQEEVTV